MLLQFLKTKIGISLIVALLIVGGAFVTKLDFTPPTENKLNAKIGLIAEKSLQNAIDSGNGSVEDWEKTLSNLISTSTLDEKQAYAESAIETPEELTATDRFAREFLTEYVNLKKSGAPIDENTGTNLVNQLLARDYGGQNEEKTYTESDIQVVNTTSVTALKKYANALGTIISLPLPKDYEQELVVLDRVNTSGNSDDLSKLSVNVERYETMRAKIALLSVPDGLKTSHIALLNSLSTIIEGVKGMILISTDPVGSTKMIVGYEGGIKSLPLIIQSIGTYFAKQGITFSPNEPGYILTR